MPVLVWAIIIFVLSTSYFSAENTSKFIDPILRFLMPGASAATIALGHGFVRKAAHFTNYAILFWLLVSGPMRARPYRAFGLCVIYALLDEGHRCSCQTAARRFTTLRWTRPARCSAAFCTRP